MPALVADLRRAETEHRAAGRLETADAVRQIADATEIQGLAVLRCCAPLRSEALELEIGWRE